MAQPCGSAYSRGDVSWLPSLKIHEDGLHSGMPPAPADEAVTVKMRISCASDLPDSPAGYVADCMRGILGAVLAPHRVPPMGKFTDSWASARECHCR